MQLEAVLSIATRGLEHAFTVKLRAAQRIKENIEVGLAVVKDESAQIDMAGIPREEQIGMGIHEGIKRKRSAILRAGQRRDDEGVTTDMVCADDGITRAVMA